MTFGADLGFATVDLDREKRQGVPEVVYGPGKAPAQIAAIVGLLLEKCTGPVLATRIEPDTAAAVLADTAGGKYDAGARICVWRPALPVGPEIAIVTAGTSDGGVANEAACSARALGINVREYHDVGVAGLHRLFARIDEIKQACAVIVVAGMEGALASVVGGLVDVPVIAVPTSVGYGTAFDGMTALHAMMSSCAAGITVVNIDNGFGAAMAAHRLLRSLSAVDST